jgi:putative addiction module component (TIGR02574 family)
MTAVATQLLSLLEPLDVSDRAEIATWLIASMDESPAQPEEGYEAAWDAELKKRSDEIQSGKVTGIPAEQVFSEIRRKYL